MNQKKLKIRVVHQDPSLNFDDEVNVTIDQQGKAILIEIDLYKPEYFYLSKSNYPSIGWPEEKGTAWLHFEEYVGYDTFSAMVHRDGISVCLIKR